MTTPVPLEEQVARTLAATLEDDVFDPIWDGVTATDTVGADRDMYRNMARDLIAADLIKTPTDPRRRTELYALYD